MARLKRTTTLVVHPNPICKWLEYGKIQNVRLLVAPKYHVVAEDDGQCYVLINLTNNSDGGLMVPIDEKIDDLEGEEIELAGCNASDKKE